MALTRAQHWGAGAYGVLFCLLLPALLVWWDRRAQIVVTWPLPLPAVCGVPLALAGALWLVAAMWALWRRGGGLPMNAFPPPAFVAVGPYRWQAHPIYCGFTLVCFGLGVACESPIACYVVAPTVALAAAALVLGYEGPALRRRFPGLAHRPLLSLPRAAEPLSARHRWSVVVLVLLPWLLLYEWIVAIGPVRGAVAAWLPGEAQWPVWQGAYAVYASAYPITATAPFWARGGAALGDFARAGLLAIAIHVFLYLVVPIAVPPRTFVPTSWLGELLAYEGRREALGAGALPSFHVTWALLVAVLAARSWPRLRPAAWAWAVAIGASCVLTGMHALADVAAGGITFAIVHGRRRVWAALRAFAEIVANSFREWRIGPLRIMVYAGYAGVAAALVVLVAGRWAGPSALPWVLAVSLGAVFGAAFWAQWIEGASVSLRPFGYYGSVVGAGTILCALPLLGVSPWPIAGGMGLAAPWAQAIGRLRCLVQGCCHGSPAPLPVGIRYTRPLSRAVRLAGLGGVPLHPTPLYSLLWNVAVGVVLLRLAQLGQPPSVVVGFYLLGNGLGRFVEEAYRGEPQTRRLFGLIEYQVYAIVSAVAGAALTCVPSAWPEHAPLAQGLLWAALSMGAFTAVAMGVDVPGSHRRFARLVK